MKAIVFDLDDTLYPESSWRRSGFASVAALLAGVTGEDPIDLVDEFEAIDGEARTRVFGRALDRRPQCPLDEGDLVDCFRGHRPTSLDLYPEGARFLERRTVQVGVVTDGLWSVQAAKVDALRLRPLVDAVVLTDLLAPDQRGWKPSPLPFEVVSMALGRASSDCIYVGDNASKDFVGAKAVGMQSVHLRGLGGYHDAPAQSDEQAATVTASGWAELECLLEEMTE